MLNPSKIMNAFMALIGTFGHPVPGRGSIDRSVMTMSEVDKRDKFLLDLVNMAPHLTGQELREALRCGQNAFSHHDWPDEAKKWFAKSLDILQKSEQRKECPDESEELTQVRALFQKSAEQEKHWLANKFFRQAVDKLKDNFSCWDGSIL